MRCILCVIPYLLLDHSADLHETFGVYTVQPQLMQGTLFNFRSKPWNRKSQFFQNINYILWGKYLIEGHTSESRYIPLSKAESELSISGKFHSNRLNPPEESRT